MPAERKKIIFLKNQLTYNKEVCKTCYYFTKQIIGLLFTIYCLLFTAFLHPVFAQQSAPLDKPPIFNVAATLRISDDKVVDGDILSLTKENESLERSKIPYDEKLYGVAVANPMMVFRTRDSLPVVRSGEAEVNITTLSGTIAIGDFITSSPIEGKGQKATDMTGYVVGVALANFTEADGTPLDFDNKRIYQGKVRVSVGIGPASPVKVQAAGGIFGTFKFLVSSLLYNIQTSKEAAKIIRYILAALVAVVTIFVNLFTFGKNVTKGIESIGRNPLARVSIQSMIILNIVLIALVSIGGIALSLVIISL